MISTKALMKLAIFLCTSTAWAQSAAFDQAVSIKGDLSHFSTSFDDGFKIDCYSTADRTVTVSKKQPPSANGAFVHESGEFVALSDYSYTISTSDKAHNLVGAQLTLPFKANNGVSDCQAFLGKLSHDGKSWKIFDGKAIHDSNGGTVGTVTQGHLDGEWMLLGRKGASKFFNFGTDDASAFHLVGGEGRQKATWVDGMEIGCKASSQKAVNVDVGAVSAIQGLPSGYQALSDYAWKVTSSNPSCTIKAHMKLPFKPWGLHKKLNIQKDQAVGKCVKVAVGCQSSNGTVAITGHEHPVPLARPHFMFMGPGGPGGPGGPFPPPPPGASGYPTDLPSGSAYPVPTDAETAAAPYQTGAAGAQGGHHGHHHGKHGKHGHHHMGLPVWGLTQLDGNYFLMVNPSSIGDCMEMWKAMPHHPWGPGGPGGPGGPDGPEEGPDGGNGGDGAPGSPDGGDGADGADAGTATDSPTAQATSGYPAPTATTAQQNTGAATSQQAPAATSGYPTKRSLNRRVAGRIQY